MNNLDIGRAKMEAWMVLKHRDHKTRAQYRREVLRFVGWLRRQPKARDVSSEKKIEAYLTARAKTGCAASTQNVAFHALRCFYEHGLGVKLEGIDAMRATDALT